jgi:NitT/TauT family transport system permease protein
MSLEQTRPSPERVWSLPAALAAAAHALLPLLAIVTVLVLWEGTTRLFQVPTYIMPGPLAIWESLVRNWTTLQKHAITTGIEALAGFALGNGIAILLAIGFVHSPIVERTVYPMAVALRTIPFVAVAPILIIWMGNGLPPKIVIAALGVFFPTLVNMVRGLQAPDREAFEYMQTLSASWMQVLWKLRWPSALPYLFAALKIAAPTAVISAVVAEWVGADQGLGNLVVTSTYSMNIALLWATVAVASLLSLLLFGGVLLLERVFVKWGHHGLDG